MNQKILKKELTSFGFWFISDKFDDEWAIEQLEKVLQITGKVKYNHIVVDRLAKICDKFPSKTVKCLAMMVEGDKEGWNIHSWKDDARKILSTAIKSADEKARESANKLVNRLGTIGYLEFRDLLESH